jgi:putative membrane protein
VAAQAASVGLDAFPFHIHFELIGIVVALAVGYVYALRRLSPRFAPQGEPAVAGREIAWFVTGLTLFLIVEAWPLHDIGEGSLFSVHMVEHLVLAFGVPPALLKGTPWWLLRLLVKPILPALRIATKPIVALIAFNGVLALIHAPAMVTLMVENSTAHMLLHVALLVTATLMWWPVIGPIPDLPKMPPFMAMGYLFIQSLVPTIPASFLTFADKPIYTVYETLPRFWGISAHTDQVVAGLIMKVAGGFLLWTVIAVIFFKWANEEERADRQSRVGLTGAR